MTTDVITQDHRDAINGRLDAMKNAAGGTKDKEKHDAGIALEATWREKAALVTEAIRAAPDLRRSRVAEVVQEWYDGETSNREANKKAAGAVAPEDPRETPEIPDVETLKALKSKGAPPAPPAKPPVPPGQARKEAR